MAPQEERAKHHGTSPQDTFMDDTENFYDTHPTMLELDPHEPVLRRSIYRRESFLVTFATSDGPPQIVILMLLLALGFGSTIGVVPAVMSDRYARLNHGYTDEKDCSAYGVDDKPSACLAGSADAQQAAAVSNLISNGLTFVTSSLMGSISDEHGRRGKGYAFCKYKNVLVVLHIDTLSAPRIRPPHSWNVLGNSLSTLPCATSNI